MSETHPASGAAPAPGPATTDLGPEFEIETVTIRGIPTRVWSSAPGTLLDVWERSAEHSDRTFLVFEDERITFTDAHSRVEAIAAGLHERFGVASDDRVAIAARNLPEWALAYWATVRLGAVAVPLNGWWTGPELAYALDHSAASVLLADQERLERIHDHVEDLPLVGVVGLRTDSSRAGAVPLAEIEGSGAARAPRPAPAPDDDATVLYTSGTTGRPKGAVGTHRNATQFLWSGAHLRAAAARAAGAPPDAATPPPATVLTFPLFHVAGLQSHLLPYTMSGGKLVLMHRWDADLAVDLIEREDVTAFSGVPTTAFELLERASARGVDLTTLAGISSGATLVPPELVRRIDDQFARRVAPANGYGLTETSGAVVYNSGADYLEHPDSVGRPLAPVNQVRIVTAAGDDAATDEPGEIWLAGPTVVRGYLDDPAATAEAFTEGWFRTGDVGRLDADGMLHVVDRLKDVVIRGGENVYAAEVEGALFEHPDVVEVAIVGLAHHQLGEEVGAAVRVRDGSTVDAGVLREHAAARLAAFKVPSAWWVRSDELPRNATGKVLKRELRDSFPR
ncbi:class I adenylate-forming enzyme family protein [Ilumatobacter sp.]|uniref:class I adenylate-forming enzyme family protein n=1 Tax=Ilumatobacter sp. TaxID=1967498 RepID=UPI003B5209C7